MTRKGGRSQAGPSALALAAACLLVAGVADPPAARASAAMESVPGEIIVRFDPSADASARDAVHDAAGVTVKRDLLLADTQLVRALPGVEVDAVLDALNGDPAVRYAEPNGLYRLQGTPDDPRLGEQWSLDNTGQTIQGIAGTPGADISALAAWDTATGSDAVKVAVIDRGIDYFHPDLAANIWRNPGEAVLGEERNGRDDDANGFVDDLYGWDFFDDDPAPLDVGAHGTPVASIIGAVGDNGIGIAGINWDTSLVALRACLSACPFAAVADAVVYARRIGADVANMSLGGPGDSETMRAAIASAPQTLFVAGAGNSGADNDADAFYPCSYDLANVICVTATDNRDNQGFNYGATSVDLGAPGVNVLAAHIDYREPFGDDFEGTTPGWDFTEAPEPAAPDTWRRTLWTGDASHRLGLEDSEGSDYPNNADTRVTVDAPIDLSNERGCSLTFDAVLATESSKDFLRVEAATSPTGPFEELTMLSGSTNGKFTTVATSLGAFEGGSVYLRLRLTSDGATTADGGRVDDVKVRCDDPTNSYRFSTGTSFAAPQVSGAAALVKSHLPGLSVAELRERILSTVDPLPSLADKTVTGGRLNVDQALTADLDPPETAIASGPANGTTTTSRDASFVLNSTEPGSTFRCKLDSADWAACTSPKAYTGLAEGSHTFKVEATDAAGNADPTPAERTWTVEATPATPPPPEPPPPGPGTTTTTTTTTTATTTTAPPPPPTLDTDPPGTTIANRIARTRDRTPAFRFRSDELAGFVCRIDGRKHRLCESPHLTQRLARGRHVFEVFAVDAAANVDSSPAIDRFRVRRAGGRRR